jgi:hypothetical protein
MNRRFSVERVLPRLVCTLKTHVLTGEGDFIPAGTPVQVVGWAEDGNQIEVRAAAYMYAGEYDYEEIDKRESHGCVGRGLWLSVGQGGLLYKSCGVEE